MLVNCRSELGGRHSTLSNSNTERVSGTANDRDHEYATKGTPRHLPCSHFHKLSFELYSYEDHRREGGVVMIRSRRTHNECQLLPNSRAPAFNWKRRNPPSERCSTYLACLAATTWARSLYPQDFEEKFSALRGYSLLCFQNDIQCPPGQKAEWEYPWRVVKSFHSTYKKGRQLIEGCAVCGGLVQKATQTL
jgi:hypothetical protein